MTSPSGERASPFARRAGWAIAVIGILAILVVTALPLGLQGGKLPFACVFCDEFALVDIVLNVLLFVPLGVGLGVARIRPIVAIAMIVGLTVFVEALQLGVLLGRDPSPRDAVTNTIGGLAGLFIGRRAWRLVAPTHHAAWRLAGGARLVWVALNAAFGWLLVPSLPASPKWVIAGDHVGGMPDFAGRVHWHTLRTQGATAGVGAPRNRQLASVAALVAPGPRRAALSPVITVVERVNVFPLLLGIEGDDIVLRLRTRAATLRLQPPASRFRDMIRPWYRTMAPPAGLLMVQAARYADRAEVRVEAGSGGRIEAEVPVRTTQGWALFSPLRVTFDDRSDWRSALWCLLLLLPLGYWTSAAREERGTAWSLAIVAAGSGFIMGPLFFSLAGPGWLELVGAAVGLLAGAALELFAASRLRGREGTRVLAEAGDTA